MVGNTVSHSKRRAKRKFNVNLFRKRFFLPDEKRWVELTVSASGIRTINKKGVVAAIRDAKEKGLIEKI